MTDHNLIPMSESDLEQEKTKFFAYIEKQKADGCKSNLLTDPKGMLVIASTLGYSQGMKDYIVQLMKDDMTVSIAELEAMDRAYDEAKKDPYYIAPEPAPFQEPAPIYTDDMINAIYEKEEVKDAQGNVISVTYARKGPKANKKAKTDRSEESETEPDLAAKEQKLDL